MKRRQGIGRSSAAPFTITRVTYWFLSFLYRRPSDTVWQVATATTCTEHPLDYMRRALEAYGPDGHQYRLLFFSEIPEDVFLRMHRTDEPSVQGAVPQAVG